METRIAPARAEDLDGVLGLLAENHLPTEGLREHLATTLVALHGDRVVGSAALEIYGDGALLRSVAVRPSLQRQRLGRELTQAAISLAQARRAPAIYLLTTTAEPYFRAFGFDRIVRGEVPLDVLTSVEFTSACPSSATVMRKRL
jgi:amino-acid N-acetyltransferase